MSDFVELVAYSPVDLWYAMAMQVAPETGYAVEVSAAPVVDDILGFGTFDD